jgi:hypothetical protein
MKLLVTVILCFSTLVFAADKMTKKIVVEMDGYFVSYGEAVRHCDGVPFVK